MSKKTVVSAPVKEVGKVNESLLVDYQNHVIEIGTTEQEAEIAFMRESVASGLSVRDQQATLKAGQAWARENGKRVLPSLTSGKVQVFPQALTILDTAEGANLLTVKELLNLAWNSRRLPEGFEIEGATIQGITDSIPAREVKDTPKTDRKAPARKMGIVEIVEALDAYADTLPEDLSTIPEVEVLAIAKAAKRLAALKRALAA